MKDQLLDIVQHTHGLGIASIVKISGTQDETRIDTVAEGRTVILQGKFKGPIAEFIGTFGMPNLGKLNTILNIPEYDEDPAITVTTKKEDKGNVVPDGIIFENKIGDFKNEYRFMSETVLPPDIKENVIMRKVAWDVDIIPTNAAAQRLKFQASANSEEPNVVVNIENGDLKFYFGDHSTHAGNFVFQSGVPGKLKSSRPYPVAPIIGILGLPGDKTFKITDGLIMITVDSGIAEYNYMIPSKSK